MNRILTCPHCLGQLWKILDTSIAECVECGERTSFKINIFAMENEIEARYRMGKEE